MLFWEAMISTIKLDYDIVFPQSKQVFLKQLHHDLGDIIFQEPLPNSKTC